MDIINFLWTFLACFLAVFVFDMLKTDSETNVGIIRRLRNRRFNYLAIIYKDIEAGRLSLQKDDDIFKQVNEKFQKRGYRFQYSSSLDKEYLESLAFVEQVITDKTLLFGYVATPTFGKKDMKELETIVKADEKIKDARAKIQYILIDKSNKNIDLTILWLVRLFSKIVVDPDEPKRRIGLSENAFSIFYICKGVYFDEKANKKDYFEAISALRKVYPTLFIPKTAGHAGDNENKFEGTFGKRKEKILKIIKEIRETKQ